MVFLLVAVILGSAVSGGFMYYVLAKAGEGVVLSARKHLVSRMLKLPIKEYDLPTTASIHTLKTELIIRKSSLRHP